MPMVLLLQEELKKEGVRMASIDYKDNLSILQLFLNKPIGLLSLLDEQSLFPKVGQVCCRHSELRYAFVPEVHFGTYSRTRE